MIDFNKELVAALSTILPTHYEMVLHSGLSVPCISYMETNNYSTSDYTTSSTLGYSRLTFQIKIWGNQIGQLQQYAIEVDRVLRELGMKRISSGELYDNNSTMIQKILTYEVLIKENY